MSPGEMHSTAPIDVTTALLEGRPRGTYLDRSAPILLDGRTARKEPTWKQSLIAALFQPGCLNLLLPVVPVSRLRNVQPIPINCGILEKCIVLTESPLYADLLLHVRCVSSNQASGRCAIRPRIALPRPAFSLPRTRRRRPGHENAPWCREIVAMLHGERYRNGDRNYFRLVLPNQARESHNDIHGSRRLTG